jgi:ATP-dependent helicase/nuclease subunit A
MRLTESQRAVVEHRGSDLLVAASAGSGKTEVLTERCLSLLTDPDNPCGVEELLVVTFTRAAAAELRARLSRKLRDAAAAAAPRLRRHLRRQALLVGLAEIGTIDSWCGRIVREHFAQAGVDPGFATLGEQDALLLRREVMDALFDGIYRGAEPLAREVRDWLACLPTPDDRLLRELIGRLNEFREHLVNPEPWFARQASACERDDAPAVLSAALAEECRFQAEQLGVLLGRASEGDGATLAPYAQALADWHRRLSDPQQLEACIAEIEGFAFPRAGRGESRCELVEEVKDRWFERRLKKRWTREIVRSVLATAPRAAARVRTLLALEARYEELLRAAKRSRSVCEFSDVLRMTLDLLGTPTEGPQRTPTDIARRLQERYAHILVDEYQDTSPVQVEILRLVSRSEPQSGNRFMVGDLKQSIYAFRRAEPRLFAMLIDAYEAGTAAGRVQYLSDNFRSHPAVLEPLNRLFALLFDRALGGTPFDMHEQLRAARTELENPSWAGRPRVLVHVVEHPNRQRQQENGETDEVGVERIEREAQLAAEHIRTLLECQVHVLDRTPDGGPVLRPLRLGDVVVLLRAARGNAGHVARVLRNNGIRCAAVGREALLDATEVNDVRTILSLLVNRRQDVALAAYLRGPVVGLTPQELLQVRQVRTHGDFFDAVTDYIRQNPTTHLAQRVSAALRRLDEWGLMAQETEVPVLIERIIRESGLRTFTLGLPGGEQRVTVLHALQSLAQTFGGGHGVAEFVEYLDTLTDEEVDPGVLAVADADVVRIMTIHAAKGLEFPVVFLLGAGNQFNTDTLRRAVLCDEAGGLGLRYQDYAARGTVLNARHLVLQQRTRQRELEEELRLLYVATTRAREQLVVIGSAAEGSWEKLRARWSDCGGRLPLIARQSVSNRLEWVLMAIAAGRLHEARDGQPPLVDVQTHAAADVKVRSYSAVPDAPQDAEQEAGTPDEVAWVQRTCALLAATPDYSRARLPAALSVSALKELAQDDVQADTPAAVERFLMHLRAPHLTADEPVQDGAARGQAYHRFLQFANLSCLTTEDEVRNQLAALVAAGRLAPTDAELIVPADLVWFATHPQTAWITRSAGAVRREVPFVYALPLGDTGESTIVRGVIDCLVETPEGIVLLDYKTDLGGRRSSVRNAVTGAPAPDKLAGDLAERVPGYRIQLQLYATAAGRIFQRPVVRALLVFLCARHVIEVPPTPPEPRALLEIIGTGRSPGDSSRPAS